MRKTFKFKRWMAFLLAFILTATTCMSSADAFLWATDENVEETAASPEEPKPAEETQVVDLSDPAPQDEDEPGDGQTPAEESPEVQEPTEPEEVPPAEEPTVEDVADAPQEDPAGDMPDEGTEPVADEVNDEETVAPDTSQTPNGEKIGTSDEELSNDVAEEQYKVEFIISEGLTLQLVMVNGEVKDGSTLTVGKDEAIVFEIASTVGTPIVMSGESRLYPESRQGNVSTYEETISADTNIIVTGESEPEQPSVDPDIPEEEADIKVKAESMVLASGESTIVSAYDDETNELIANENISWSSSDETVAVVDESGKVTAKDVNESLNVTITGSRKDKENCSGSVTIRVDKLSITTFSLSSNKTVLVVGDRMVVTTTIVPDTISDMTVAWSSSDESVATIDANGNVEAVSAGTVVITGISNYDGVSTDNIVLTIEDQKVTDLKITGMSEGEYLIVGKTKQLGTKITPDDAVDKKVSWSSSDESVATVDQNGKVTAVKQGKAFITAENESSGVYDKVEIQVYASTPKTQEIKIWVTNRDEDKKISVNVPADGTPVNISDVIPATYINGSNEYTFTGVVRHNQYSTNAVWGNICKEPLVKRLKFVSSRVPWSDGSIQYSSSESGDDFVTISKSICAFYELVYDDAKDMKVIVGDWPYADGASIGENKKTITIQVIDKENGQALYGPKKMRYSDGSKGYYGKIKLSYDQSVYEPDGYDITKNDQSTDQYIVEDDGISVQFENNNQLESYVVTLYVRPRMLEVRYDANGGSGDVPVSEKYKAGTSVVVSANPQPSRAGYVFGGWQYGGGTYKGGESFTMPSEDVQFLAKWIPEGSAIKYIVNNPAWGRVTNPSEVIVEGVSPKGSYAIPVSADYQFVGWYKDDKLLSTEQQIIPSEQGVYEARFEELIPITQITINAASLIATYDGKVKRVSGFNESQDQAGNILVTVNGRTFRVEGLSASAEGTNVSDSKDVVIEGEYRVFEVKSDKDVTDRITLIRNNGKLTIQKRIVTLKSADLKKVYDGTPLRNEDHALQVETGWVGDQGATYSFTGVQTEVGESPNSFTYEFKGGTDENNYMINKSDGKLEVTQSDAEIVVTTTGGTFTYDGKPHGATVEVSELPDG
ncbi:MAG: Ig-like domain-containing protein, partial [Lachnospiraceae bacterium]|nr:Ig-like domain-containing protein [Lachnospiraceae bacterium]